MLLSDATKTGKMEDGAGGDLRISYCGAHAVSHNLHAAAGAFSYTFLCALALFLVSLGFGDGICFDTQAEAP